MTIVRKTYTAEVYCNGRSDSNAEDITPLRTLEPGVHMLELSNGPTLAFKDMAMQLLGNLFEYVLAKQRDELNILGATSGDTGSAAEYAMRGKTRHPRVHAVAARQDEPFQTRADVFAAGPQYLQHRHPRRVRRCQDIVKAVSNDHAFKAQAQDRHGQFDQLGARVGAGGVLLQGLFRRDRSPTTNRSRFPCRPATSATSAPGTSRA